MLEARWETIANGLRRQIENGDIMPGDKIPPETELMQQYGVARMTVHRAMKQLQDEGLVLRRRGIGTVVASHEKVGTHTVALILQNQESTFEASYSAGIRQTLPEDYRLLVNASMGPVREAQYLKRIRREADGLIILPSGAPENTMLIQSLSDSGYPMVVIDRIPENLRVDSVVTDNQKAVYDAVRTLIKCGHRRISFFSASNFNVSSVRERYDGYVQAMVEAGITEYPRWVRMYPATVSWDFFLQAITDTISALTGRDEPITAAFTIHDIMLAGVLEACDKLNIKVPEELEFVSICDLPAWTVRESAGVNRIVQQTRIIGAKASELLMKQIRGEQTYKEVIKIPALFYPNSKCTDAAAELDIENIGD